MRRLAGALGAALLLAAGAAAPARAQEPDSYVLPAGAARFSAGLSYTYFDARFAEGGAAGLGDAFAGPLTSATFSPLATLESRINAFLAANGSAVRANPAAMSSTAVPTSSAVT